MTTWMVVEDEHDLYEMVLAMYELMGVDGLAFIGGEEAIAWIEEVEAGDFTEELPELALLDLRLPGRVSGIDIGARMRSSPQLHDVPLVLMTAYRLSPKDEDAILAETGAEMLLYKPLPDYDSLRDLFFEVVTR